MLFDGKKDICTHFSCKQTTPHDKHGNENLWEKTKLHQKFILFHITLRWSAGAGYQREPLNSIIAQIQKFVCFCFNVSDFFISIWVTKTAACCKTEFNFCIFTFLGDDDDDIAMRLWKDSEKFSSIRFIVFWWWSGFWLDYLHPMQSRIVESMYVVRESMSFSCTHVRGKTQETNKERGRSQ